MKKRMRVVVLLSMNLLICFTTHAQKHTVNVKGRGLNPMPVLDNWGGKRAGGARVYANNYHIMEGGKPLAITMGEFHPQRYPQEEWENALLEIKAGGINTISFYVFWSLIEAYPGQFNFSGNNNIRYFIELCQKHGLKAIPRIGPYNNSEFLIGGLPPWIYGMPYRERSNDPGYLAAVKNYYSELSKQMKGLYWQQGGPIYYVQLENELGHAPVSWETYYKTTASDEHRGPKDGEEWTKHYYNLRDIAQEVGINPLYFSATAWGKHPGDFPEGFLPFFGGYMYLFPPGKNNSRITSFRTFKHVGKVPVGFCELGAAGTPTRLNFSIFPPAISAVTTATTALGSIETLTLGYYLYHGGSNPVSERFGFMGKTNNMAMISYDFRAPISEFGQPRPAYYMLRPIHQFLLNYSEELANTQLVQQDIEEKNLDHAWMRLRARANNNSGFLITSYYGNVNPFNDTEVKMEVTTDDGSIHIPSSGKISIKNGYNCIFPFNLTLKNGVKLISATAQPTSILETKGEYYQFFISPHDQSAEFVIATKEAKRISYNEQKFNVNKPKATIKISPDKNKKIKIVSKSGKITNLVLLSNDDAEHSIETNFNGQKYLLISNQDIISTNSSISLSKCKTNDFSFLSFPQIKGVSINGKSLKPKKNGLFTEYNTSLPKKEVALDIVKINDVKTSLFLKPEVFEELNDVYISFNFSGDICRLFDLKDGTMIGDEFGGFWRIGLKRFKNQLANDGLMLRTTAGAKVKNVATDDNMLLDEEVTAKKDIVSIGEISIEPEYKVTFEIKN
ncbi:beta-galactosidase [Tamlana crocina]|uniref:Glycoside hydrolase 35 catalytic domain-containing protein n=1 Tax=Tamlana crocina TaxID=393006 RepID=A0ABX1D7K8_9FLAO|nr:beta-galactosidase [Tamlana crocina]NJX14321.1 hypothetical protein [Tamlana crocina]